jgi:hypothetical protein
MTANHAFETDAVQRCALNGAAHRERSIASGLSLFRNGPEQWGKGEELRSIIVGTPVDYRAARTLHPDGVVLDGRVEVTAAFVFPDEGMEVGEQRHACDATSKGRSASTSPSADTL